MVLALAMSLAGLNPEDFKGLIEKLTPESKLGAGQVEAARPASPSARSESSGVSSLASSSLRSLEGSSPWPWPSPSSSRTPSVRSTEGNSPWLTPSSSTAPSVRSNEGSTASLTPASSRAPSVRSNDGSTPSVTPISSRPATPAEDSSNNETMMDTTLVDVQKLRRDILNLAANIREPGWQVIKPPMTNNDPFSYEGINTVNNCLEEFKLREDYPMRCCEKCGFDQPSPFLENGTTKVTSK